MEFLGQYGQLIAGLVVGLLTATGVSALVIAKIAKIARTVGDMAHTFADKLEQGELAGASAKQVKGSIETKELALRVTKPLVARAIGNLARRLDAKRANPEKKESTLGAVGRFLLGTVAEKLE